jgi:hypothetical protein
VHAALRPPLPPQRIIPLTTNTKAVVRAGSPVVSIQRSNPDGSQLVVRRTYIRGRPVLVGAFLARRRADGALERSYIDGRKVIVGRDFVARVTPTGITFTTHPGAMLSEATAANGRPIYRDRLETRRYGTASRQVVVRTIYAHIIAGAPTFLAAPVTTDYLVTTAFGVPVLAYQPAFFPSTFITPFSLGFTRPVVVGPRCYLCPSPLVLWQAPVLVYGDPIALVADLAISTAVDDGVAEAPPVYDAPPPPAQNPEVADLQAQVAALQEQADLAARDNADLRAQIAALEASPPPPPAPPAPAVMSVPEDVRQQIRDQVRSNVALHQQQTPLTWPDIVTAGDPSRYVFQVSEMIDAVDATGSECALTAGDLLRLAAGATPRADVLTLEVVTSKAGSCTPGSQVSVGMRDAQQMLNDFNVRQEAIMRQVQPNLVTPGGA